ncbi:metallophosphoesterase family protein [Nocardioides mesophilus]|uniref:Calcineurin-like phosphoesterase domain-containing protein n=1 Tax=Nocardioides mesophilus TaxID=433659 RepID=A0A7G9RDX3_9ACTN|nr:metallophosphoesterase [Nocardioides mesophilus]QNN53798.1 hypothetical protein H9L09_05165 [Nocardioides mesophilus]
MTGADPASPTAAPRRSAAVRAQAGRLLLAVALAAVVAAPLALGWAVSTAHVEEPIGVTPTTFTLTTAGRSELRLGLLGTLYLPRSRGPVGVVATVEGPAVPQSGGDDLAAYVSPDILQLYTGLFHDPGPAVEGYVDLLSRDLLHRLLLAEGVLAGLGGLALYALLRVPANGGARSRRRTAAAVVGALVLSTAGGLVLVRPAATAVAAEDLLALPALDGTVAEGSTTNSPLLRLLLGDAVPKVQRLLQRQEDRAQAYRQEAAQALAEQAPRMSGPRDGETAVLMQSDMHCNVSMIDLQGRVVTLLRDRYGEDVPALMAITGDLTTNGTAAERGCVQDEAGIAGDAPVVAVTGNHESRASVTQMEDAGMTLLTGSTLEAAGVRLLGDGDPERSELFGATRLRGEETEADVGTRLFEVAAEDRPDLLLVHEAYAAQAFIGTDDMTDFLEGRGSPTLRSEDGVRDLPASAVFYGHWHRPIEPRVVWNSDGTWTLVMELNTSGGAIDTPTLGRFSTPWSRPRQQASFPVVFLDQESGLVTGYQLYEFDPDGAVRVLPRVDVGDGLPAASASP